MFVVVIFLCFSSSLESFWFYASLSLVSGCGCAVRACTSHDGLLKMCAFAKHHTIERYVCADTRKVVCVCVVLVHRVSDRDGTKAKIVVSMCCSVFYT